MESLLTRSKFSVYSSRMSHLIPFDQSFSQGEREDELDFRAYCGDAWDRVIEKKFMEWSMRMFGSEYLRGVARDHALTPLQNRDLSNVRGSCSRTPFLFPTQALRTAAIPAPPRLKQKLMESWMLSLFPTSLK